LLALYGWRPRTSALFPYTTLFRSQIRCGGCPGRGGGGGQRHRGTAGAGGEQEAAAAQGSPGHRRPSGASVTRWLPAGTANEAERDRKSTRLNSSHVKISYAVFCLK